MNLPMGGTQFTIREFQRKQEYKSGGDESRWDHVSSFQFCMHEKMSEFYSYAFFSLQPLINNKQSDDVTNQNHENAYNGYYWVYKTCVHYSIFWWQ